MNAKQKVEVNGMNDNKPKLLTGNGHYYTSIRRNSIQVQPVNENKYGQLRKQTRVILQRNIKLLGIVVSNMINALHIRLWKLSLQLEK